MQQTQGEEGDGKHDQPRQRESEPPHHEGPRVADVDDLHNAINNGEAVRHPSVQPRRQQRRDGDRDQVLGREHRWRRSGPSARLLMPASRYWFLGIGSTASKVSGIFLGQIIRTAFPGRVWTIMYGDPAIWPLGLNRITPPGTSALRNSILARASRTAGPSRVPAFLTPASSTRAVS